MGIRQLSKNDPEFWDDQKFLARIRMRARQLGKSVETLLSEAGIHLGRNTLKYTQADRTLSTIGKVAVALRWTVPDVMGWPVGTDRKILALAYEITRRVLDRLPPDIDRDKLLVEVLAASYDTLMASQREGHPIDRSILRLTEESMVAAFYGQSKRP